MPRSAADHLVPLSVVSLCLAGLAVAGQLGPEAGAPGRAAAGAHGAAANTVAALAWTPQPGSRTALTRIAFGSCLVQGRAQPIWQAVIAARPQTFLMMGDNVYGDFKGTDGAPLKAAYDALAATAAFRQAAASMAMLATWDDHDYGQNDGGGAFTGKAVATRLFADFWAGSGTLEGERGPGIAYARDFGPRGRLTQIIMLDTRSFRDALKRKPKDDKGKGRYVPDEAADKTLLGEAQWAWLEAQLARPADLRVIVSSIQVIAQGHRFERWGNLPAERRRLFDVIAKSQARNVVFLSGDRHRAGLYRLDRAEGGAFIEATSSSLNRSFDDPEERGPHQIGAMFGGNNFGLIEIDWATRVATISIRDETGITRRATAIALEETP